MSVPVLDLAAQYHELKRELDEAVTAVIASSTFIAGEEVRAFEQEFASYLRARHVVGVANGTDALELALQALGIGPGDAVLTVPFTFFATVEAIVRAGATPVFADIHPDDFTLDAERAAEAFERHRIKAVIVVHLFGHPADLDRLLPLARRYGAMVIEDAAQAHGACCTLAGERRRVGAIADVGCFSFYPTKNLGAMGDAGAVVTNRDDIAERVRLLANHGDAGKYQHVIATGRNSRLDALQAAVLRVKLRRLDAWNAARRAAAGRYGRLLADLPVRLPRERAGTEAVYHQYAIRVANRDGVRSALAAQGIATALHYPLAIHQQPACRPLDVGQAGFPIAEQSAAEVLSLPMFPHVTGDAVAHVAETLRALLTHTAGAGRRPPGRH